MRTWLLSILLFVACGSSWAQRCPYWHTLTFGDGRTACLTDYPLAQARPIGFSQPVAELLSASAPYYNLAMVRGGPQCPQAVGLGRFSVLSGEARARELIALAPCEAALKEAGSPSGCRCEIVFSNGASRLSRMAFEVSTQSGASSAAARPPATAAAPPAAPVAALVAAPVAAPVVASAPAPVPAPAPTAQDSEAARNKALIEALQQRLAQIEADRAQRPAAAPPAPPPAPVVPRQTVRALVIGNGRYQSFSPLANPANDARAIAAKLRSFGIEVDLLLDAQRDDIIHALNEHSRHASGKDVSILFYAGHGVQVEGVNYMIPVNMRADGISAGYVKLAGISLNAAMDYLPAKTRIVFLDACRDNAATRMLTASRAATAIGLAPVQAASGTLVAYATRDGATADDGTGPNSPYTTALLRHIDEPVDVSLMLRLVRQTVLQMTSGRQEPWEYGSLVGAQIVLPLMAK